MLIIRIRLIVQNYIDRRGYIGKPDLELQVMLRRLINWFKGAPAPSHRTTTQYRRRSNAHAALRKATERAPQNELTPDFPHSGNPVPGHLESTGPGKNVLIRNKHIREDTGTHEKLTIFDDSVLDTDEEDGIDPYNSGEFDRSKHWDKRFRN